MQGIFASFGIDDDKLLDNLQSQLISIPLNFSMDTGTPNSLNEYPIHFTLVLNLTGIRLDIGDYLNIALKTCWKDKDDIYRDATPTVKLIGNASFSFSDDLDMQNRDFHFDAIDYSEKSQIHLIIVPVEKFPSIWNFSIIANLENDFTDFLSPKLASFCKVEADVDKGRIFEHPDLTFPMILEDYESFYEETTEDYVIKLNLDRFLQKNDKIFIWILGPWNFTMNSAVFDPESL
jgi:hypothetical protein